MSVLGSVEPSMLQDQGTSSTVTTSPLHAAGTCRRRMDPCAPPGKNETGDGCAMHAVSQVAQAY